MPLGLRNLFSSSMLEGIRRSLSRFTSAGCCGRPLGVSVYTDGKRTPFPYPILTWAGSRTDRTPQLLLARTAPNSQVGEHNFGLYALRDFTCLSS
jgi:hypothetical protein